jgi:hypothetical protein
VVKIARTLAPLLLLAARAHADDSLGVDPTRPRGGALLHPSDDSDDSDGYKFHFHGFLRVPMLVGLQGKYLHSPPQIPDGDYTDWRFTNVNGGPWTELWFQYGNGTVSANVVIAAYDITDASYRDLLSQLGIAQSFVTINSPQAFGDRGGLTWNVGAFSNRYGTAAQYDAGKYDTYLFGATHVGGETVSGYYELSPSLTLAIDHGVGAKMDVTPLVPGLEAPYLPYPGDVQQGSTLLHHAHVGLVIGDHTTVAAHYLTEWTQDARLDGDQDGRVTNVGADVKVIASKYGDAYLGYSHIKSVNPLRVAGAFEAIHSFEGWNLRDNYFGPDATGTGTIDTVLAQYSFSLARYLWAPKEFDDEGPDLVFAAFGMFNHVASADPAFTGAPTKLKVGGEVTYTPRKWLGLDLRYDLVQPDMRDRDYSFHVISPSAIIHTAYGSNEEIVVGFSHYVNGSKVVPAYPADLLPTDTDVLRCTVVMWW